MNNDREGGRDERPTNQPEETAGEKQREAVNRFAQYTAPAMLAVLLGNRAFAQAY
jgi:hypothetical protein